MKNVKLLLVIFMCTFFFQGFGQTISKSPNTKIVSKNLPFDISVKAKINKNKKNATSRRSASILAMVNNLSPTTAKNIIVQVSILTKKTGRIVLSEKKIRFLKGRSSQKMNLSFQLPAQLNFNQKKRIQVSVKTYSQKERNLKNNIVTLTLPSKFNTTNTRKRCDLKFHELKLGQRVIGRGSKNNLTAMVKNISRVSSSPTTISFYLTKNPRAKKQFRVLGTSKIDGIKAMQSALTKFQFQVSKRYLPGEYYLIAKINSGSNLELSTKNNTRITKVIIR